MANESDNAYKTYLNAMDTTKTNALITLQDGTIGDTLLTANKIFTYHTLSKQYSLKNDDGKTLVSSTLHDAYKSTNSLSEFLQRFGLISKVEYTVPDVEKNPDYNLAVKDWESDHDKWENDMIQYEKDYQDWLDDHEYWEDVDHPGWETREPDPADPKYTITGENLGDKFMQAGDACYQRAKNDGNVGCYRHVLAHIIDYFVGKGWSGSGANTDSSWYDGTKNQYTTSTGDTFILDEYHVSGTCDKDANAPIFAEVSKKIDDENAYKVAIKEGETCDVTEASSDGEKLLSKWNPDGTLKSIKQWAKDLFYLCGNYTTERITKEQLKQSVIDFQEGLAGSMSFNEELFNQDHKAWVDSEPKEPIAPVKPEEPLLEDYINGIPEEIVHPDKKIETTSFTNENEAQWYINQWYKMEGLDKTAEIKDEKVFNTTTNSYMHIYSVDNINKSTTTYTTNAEWGTEENENYLVLQEGMLQNDVWLHNMIKEGFIQIQVFDEFEHKFMDTSIAVDTRLEEVHDEEEIKKAEAEYEAALNKINKKETKADEELSKLEAERNAISTQQEDLKKIIRDNIDLSFKLFS